MADISNSLIKNTFDYVLQSDIATGMVYRIGGQVPINPIFSLGLTIEDTFTYSNGSEQPGYVLTCDASGNATWSPVSGTSTGNYLYLTGGTLTGPLYGTIISATTISGVTFYGDGTNLTGIPDTYVTGGTYSAGTLTFTNNTGGTFSITGVTTGGNISGEYLPLSGGTVTGSTTFTDGIYVDRIGNVNFINFNTNPPILTGNPGELFYDINENALSYKPITTKNDVTVNIGQEELIRIYNDTGTQINNGQAVHITGSTYGIATVGLAVASDGNNPYFQVNGVATHDIADGDYGFITYFGVIHDLDLSMFNVGDQLYLSQTTPGGLVTFNDLYFTGRTIEIGHVLDNSVNGKIQLAINNEFQVSNITLTEQNILNADNSSTGVFDFTGITKTSNTTFSVAPAKGWIIDNTTNPLNPTINIIEFSGATNIDSPYRTTDTITYILLNSTSTLTLQPTPPTPQQRRENIFLGKIGHPNKTNFSIAFQVTDYVQSPISQLRDMFIPIPLINGGIYPYPNGANLSFNNTAGTLYGLGISYPTSSLNPNSISVSGQTPVSFQYRTQTGGTTSNVTSIDPLNYDLNGTVTPITGTKATNQRIYILQDGSFRAQYGQTVYNTFAQAVAGLQTETFTTFPNFRDNGILIAVLSILSTCTDLTDTTKAQFFFTSKFGETVGAAGGFATTTLQQAYNNSSNPEILTNATLDGFSVRNGTGNADNLANNYESINSSGVTTAFIRADGAISGSTIYGNGANLFGLNYITGGTFNSGNKTLTLISATGQTINITGFTDTFVTGGTKSGSNVIFTNSTGGTFTVTGFTDTFVTGGTYSSGTAIFTNNSGGTFNVTGYSKYFVTGSTPSANLVNGDRWFDTTNGVELVYFYDGDSYQWVQLNDSATITGQYLPLNGGIVTGATVFTSGLTANTISATTYQNLPLDIRVTGASYNNNTFTFTNNTGGTFSVLFNTVTGLTTNTISATTYQNLPLDIRVTGASYNNNTFTFTNNTGGTFSTLFNTVTGLTVNDNLTVTGTTAVMNMSGSTSNQIRFGTNGVGAPTYNTYSQGIKLLLNDNISSISSGMAIGCDTGIMWYGADLAGNMHSWYAGTNNLMNLSSSGGLELKNLGSPTSPAFKISGANTKGGAGYFDFLQASNTGATNPNKWFRVNSVGSLEILNSAYNSVLFSLSDVGQLNIGLATTSSSAPTSNYISLNSSGNTVIYDDGNSHIHNNAANQAMWINTNGGQLNILSQVPLSGGAKGTGVVIGGDGSITGFLTVSSGKTYTTAISYGYLSTGGAGTYPGGSQSVTTSIYAVNRIMGQEIDAFSDERMKDIQGNIKLEEAVKLVKDIVPIKFTWKEGDDKKLKAGYSAQQVSKAGFDHLISVLPKEGLEEQIDDDGFVSPKDTQFIMNYDQVTPYHGVVIKHLLEKIESLEETIKDLQNKIK